ncbi:MAG: type II toxin-antitoxin system HicA family toxin [bacterium]|nr:type II toxin-antitoxin system HicA family toxin [bacterium]
MLPVLKAAEIIRALLKAGFRIIRSRGSHFRFEHLFTKRRVTVSFHGGDVPKKTLRSILNQAALTVEEFLRYLRGK